MQVRGETSRATSGTTPSLALVAASFLWGSTFLVVKDAVDDADVMPFLAARFLVGAAVLWPIAHRRPSAPMEVRHGVLAGTALLVGFVFQTVGLQYTTSSSSAFITYLLVVFVPVIGAVLDRRLPGPVTVAGVALAVVGLLLLSGGVEGFGRGEWLTLGCALSFAVHLVMLDRTSHRHDAIRLTFWQVLTVGLGCLGPGAVLGGFGFAAATWSAVVFTGVGATALALLCMVWAQRTVPPTRAALLLLLEPVFAAVLGYMVGERLGGRGFVGAALILVAVLAVEFSPMLRDKPPVARHADV